MLKEHLYTFLSLFLIQLVSSAPKSWPYMKSHDIWGSDNYTIDSGSSRSTSNSFRNFIDTDDNKIVTTRERKAKGEDEISKLYLHVI